MTSNVTNAKCQTMTSRMTSIIFVLITTTTIIIFITHDDKAEEPDMKRREMNVWLAFNVSIDKELLFFTVNQGLLVKQAPPTIGAFFIHNQVRF